MVTNKSTSDRLTQLINYYISSISNYNGSVEYRNRVLISMKRLQKLVYLFEALYMKEHHGKPYLTEDFYCWPSGPVIPKIYQKHLNCNTGLPNIIPDVDLPSQGTQAFVNYILELTKDIDTSDLGEKIKCAGSPWFEVKHGPHIKQFYDVEQRVPSHELVISKRKIYHYYKDRNIFD